MMEAFANTYADLEAIGHKSKLHLLNDECSRTVKSF